MDSLRKKIYFASDAHLGARFHKDPLAIEKRLVRWLDSIKNEYAKTALPLQNRIKRLESDVKDYVDCHRAEMAGKSRTLNFGTVGYRISSKLMLPTGKVAEAIATLKAMGRKEFIKTTESLDREALKRQPLEFLNQIGAYIRQSDEFYYDVSDEQPDMT